MTGYKAYLGVVITDVVLKHGGMSNVLGTVYVYSCSV